MSLPAILEFRQEDVTELEDKMDIYGEDDPTNIHRKTLLEIEGERDAESARFYPKYLEQIRDARRTGNIGNLDVDSLYDLAIQELHDQKSEQRRKAKEAARLQRDSEK
jgi:hypothetical protein